MKKNDSNKINVFLEFDQHEDYKKCYNNKFHKKQITFATATARTVINITWDDIKDNFITEELMIDQQQNNSTSLNWIGQQYHGTSAATIIKIG